MSSPMSNVVFQRARRSSAIAVRPKPVFGQADSLSLKGFEARLLKVEIRLKNCLEDALDEIGDEDGKLDLVD